MMDAARWLFGSNRWREPRFSGQKADMNAPPDTYSSHLKLSGSAAQILDLLEVIEADVAFALGA
jgi:hypothetical protein